MMKSYTKDHVWKWIKRGNENECWEWQGPQRSRGGYGEIGIDHKRYRVHRLVYELANKVELPKITRLSPSSCIVMHTCDNPICCNPKHLILGSPKQNTADMMRKGRRYDFSGERGQCAKLTNVQAEEIRELCRLKIPQKDIAARYGVSVPTVSGIKWNRVYRGGIPRQ
jgi:DNA-binding CsgD family transcriptional regulator